MTSGFIDVNTTAKILGVSTQRVRQLFLAGQFHTAHQITVPKGWWRVSRAEVIMRLTKKPKQNL